jgi:hypothetical protein
VAELDASSALALVFAASAPGFHHVQHKLASQDAWGHGETATGAVVVAVADGHGHHRHFRSGRGSALAVEVARRDAIEWVTERGVIAQPSSATVTEAFRAGLLVRIWRDWLTAVDDDLVGTPFSRAEEEVRQDDDAVIAYGTTLLVAVVAGDWVLLGQIGDGDMVAVTADGTVSGPIPTDPVLDAFRVAAIDLRSIPLALLLLATDGFGNAQIDDPWQPGVGADLMAMLAEHGGGWIGTHLPDWVERCASAHGSGDDTTVALVMMP